jgi:hypothetical protein
VIFAFYRHLIEIDIGEKYDRVCIRRTISGILDAKVYNHSEHWQRTKFFSEFKGGIIVRKYIPMKRKHFCIRIYKLCDKSGCAYDMRVYLE